MRRCNQTFSWIPLDAMVQCSKYKAKSFFIPKGAYGVRFVKKGYAYVDIDGVIVKIPYQGEKVDYLFLEQTDNGYVIKE